MPAPYDPEALRAEIPLKEEQIKLFEAKVEELREQIAQYRVWIKQHEEEEAANA